MTAPQLFATPVTEQTLMANYLMRLEAEAERLTGSIVKANTKLDEVADEIAAVRSWQARQTSGEQEAALPSTAIAVDPHTGVVNVTGPGVDPFTCPVGIRTRFAALIFAYAEQAGIMDPDPAAWRILDPSGHEVDGGIIIPRSSWGYTYVVKRRAGA